MFFRVGWYVSDNKIFLANLRDRDRRSRKTRDLFLCIILLYYASMQSEIDGPSETDSLKQCISELKARIVKLEDKQTWNELVKNLLSVP